MLLSLSESFSDSLEISENGGVICDLSLSEGVLAQFPEDSRRIFETIQETFPRLWKHLSPEIADNPWIISWAEGRHQLNLSVIVVNNAEIQALNQTYRNKDTATDVLTFSLLEDPIAEAEASQLPELHLGEVYISLEWAKDASCKESMNKLNLSEDWSLFMLERLVHGCLHLLGVHHNTMSDYNKVVTIQRTVLDALSHQ